MTKTDWRSKFTSAKGKPLWWLVYEDYMASKEWDAKRKRILKRDCGCRVCNHQHELQVHHRTYDRVGDEDMMDLTVLCRECHKTVTRMMRRRRPKGKVFDNVIEAMPSFAEVDNEA